ncbi:uncharacterized protein LOC133737713 [Rosa rugosa]|uniref:uncharacterized protein LOC133737713 n=1 Tax=Rosa rugosa TaxID=74645 RepID=UPI002B40D7F7|nr:uncharacterized protein LOC133737713 [Rosa rugosa]
MDGFRDVVDVCGLHDMQFSGPKFTWKGIRGGMEVRVRLDRFLASIRWMDCFPKSRVIHLKPCTSDHLPILMEVREARARRKRKKKRFCFEECWLRDEECKRVVERGWESVSGSDPFAKVCNKISNTRSLLMEWSNTSYGSLKEEIEKTGAQLAIFFDESLSAPPTEVSMQATEDERTKLKQVFWRQRAKVFWLSDGDLNTKFFHQYTSNRRRKNQIKGLYNEEGVWCTTDEELEHVVLNYFGKLFTSSNPSTIHEVVSMVPSFVSEELNNRLTKEITYKEVYDALKQMHPSKAPGPDGFSPCFYQHFWPVVGGDVVDAIRSFLEEDELIRQLNCTHVTLIPKVKKPETMSHLRPISLCNVLYKIGSKVIANRLKPLLQNFISPYQSAFVPGRLISDNSLVAYEIAHFLKRRRDGKVGFGALKLDMSKAYDRVEWPFLEAILFQMGFHTSRNIPLEKQEALATILGVSRVDKHESYLGLPMDVSYSKMEAFGFLLEKIKHKIQGWRQKTLSQAGKEVLLKSVVKSVPTYVMSCFQLPMQLCNEIHQLMARFWWGSKEEEKKIHWLAWERLCIPKGEGGMGFRDLVSFNLSLLAKQGWMLITNPESIAARLFKAKYFPNSDFMQAEVGQDMSYTWRSILAGREVLARGLRYQIGSGTNVSVWEDPWLPLPYNFKPFSTPMVGTEDWLVSDLIDSEQQEWIQPVIEELFTEREMEIILGIPLSLRPVGDRKVWHYDKKGLFNVKSGYYVARKLETHTKAASSSAGVRSEANKVWKAVWRARVPPKVKSFVWRLLRGILPTRDALRKKVRIENPCCLFCNKEVETDVHVFKKCVALECFWSACNVGFRPSTQPGTWVQTWISEVVNSCTKAQVDKFFTCLWVIWSERNHIAWKGGCFNAWNMAAWAAHWLEEFQKVHPHESKGGRRPKARWLCPPRGRLKVNMDGAYRSESGQYGLGVVARDGDGTCMAALARPLSFVTSPLHVEAEAVRAGLLLAIH